MEWLFLFLAIFCEVIGTTNLKLSNGFTRPVPSATSILLYAVAIVAMSQSMKKLDMSLTYAVWSGLGTAVVAIIGVIYFKEPKTALKIVSLCLIVIGLIGLQLSRRPL